MNSKAAQDTRSEAQVAARLSHIRIVLINTSHPGNIGATARAMKVMGLTASAPGQSEDFSLP